GVSVRCEDDDDDSGQWVILSSSGGQPQPVQPHRPVLLPEASRLKLAQATVQQLLEGPLGSLLEDMVIPIISQYRWHRDPEHGGVLLFPVPVKV
ncbi:hypothetical protein JZ751_016902, partial [Albula glossodonta]